MLTDKDIRDIKVLANESGMDYFIKEVQRDHKPYHEYWQPMHSEGDMPNRAEYFLYQLIPFEGRTLHVAIASWLIYPSFSRFQNMLTVEGLQTATHDLYDVYRNLHPDLTFKARYAINTFINEGYLPTSS